MEKMNFYREYYRNTDNNSLQWREAGGKVKAQNIINILVDFPIRTILDIGCGTGAVLANLASAGFGESYYAIDIADQAIDYVKKRSDIPGLLDAKFYDGINIPYQSGFFDVAILSHVLEHLSNPVRLLNEAARVANLVVIEVPLEDNLYTFIKVKLLKSKYREEIGHIQWYNLENFQNLIVETCHLSLLKIKVVYQPSSLYYLRKRGLPKAFTSVQIGIRKLMHILPEAVYTRLLTEHCIALTKSNENTNHP